MTREEAKDKITELAKENFWGCGECLEALGMAIKALEQEPFINKPCVSSEVCERDKQKVLDKIRAEIAEYGSIMVTYAITNDTKTDKGIEKLVSDVLQQAKEEVLQIIDKHKAESED